MGYIQQEATPALQVGVVAMGSQRAEGSRAPIKGWVVEVVHWTLAAGQRGTSSWPGAASLGDSGDPPPLFVGGTIAAVGSRVSAKNLRGVPPEAARGPDEGPWRWWCMGSFSHHLHVRWRRRGGGAGVLIRQQRGFSILVGQLLHLGQLTVFWLAVTGCGVIAAVSIWVEAAGAWKHSPVVGPTPNLHLLFPTR